jgi:stage IV sporulation protein FB
MKIFLHPLFIAVIVLAFLLGSGFFALSMLAAVVVHELSHAFVARRVGIHTDRLRLLPFGAEVTIDCAYIDSDKRIAILLAGAAGNLLVVISLGSLLWLFPMIFMSLEALIICNAVTAGLNLLPIYPLDGGKIIEQVLSAKAREHVARKTMNVVSSVIFIVTFVLCAVFFFNLALLLFCIFMFVSINMDFRATVFRSKIYRHIGSHKNKVIEVAVSSTDDLLSLYKLVSPTRTTKFVLVDENNKAIYENELEKLLLNHPVTTKLRDVL